MASNKTCSSSDNRFFHFTIGSFLISSQTNAYPAYPLINKLNSLTPNQTFSINQEPESDL